MPPVASPLTAGAIARGAASGLGLDGGWAVREVTMWLDGLGVQGALRTDSGTSALTLALRAAAPALVALPAWGCYDLATAADGADVPVWLYDLDPRTLGPADGAIEAALAAGAGVVVLAHFFGVPVDVPRVRRLADAAGALVVEDAAQGAGMTIAGRPAGAHGSLGVLSFGRGKGITGGRGGALLAGDARGLDLLARARAACGAGTRGAAELPALVAQWLLARPSLYALPAALPWLRLGETVYHPPVPPRAQSACSAGVLAATLPLAAGETRRRRAHAAVLLPLLAQAGLAVPASPAGSEPGWLRLPASFSSAAARARHLAAGRALGVMPGYPMPLARLDGFRGRVRNAGEDFPGASALADRLVTLPVHGGVGAHDLERLRRWIAATAD